MMNVITLLWGIFCTQRKRREWTQDNFSLISMHPIRMIGATPSSLKLVFELLRLSPLCKVYPVVDIGVKDLAIREELSGH
jgi:hypothetical protein